jgi:uncharacterized membrane protein
MISRIHVVLVLSILALDSLLGLAFHTAVLPERVPIHWNAAGQADGLGPAWVNAFVMPAIGWVVMALLLLAAATGPFRSGIARFPRIYGRILVTATAVLALMHVVVLLASAGKPVPVGPALTMLAGLVVAAMGNWMGKVRRNALVGIRTPWTLADDVVWERTNRLGGRIVFVFGLALVAAGCSPRRS